MTKECKLKRCLPPLLGVLAVAVALGVGEIVARAFKLAPPFRPITVSYEDSESIYQRSSNPILGYELKPGYYNPNPDNNFTCSRINSHGQRDIGRSVKKPRGVRRVILLGDSIVESTEIHDVDDVMNRQLEKLYPDGKTEVLNFGVGGYCTLAEVELLRVKGLKFEPDVVIVVFFFNDFENFNSSIVESLAAGDAPSPLFRGLFKSSHLFRAALVRFGWTSFGMRQDPVVRNKEAIGENNVVQGLELLRRLASEHGFRPAIAVWPVFRDDGITDEGVMPDGATLIIEELASAAGIPCYRLSPAFRKHYATSDLQAGPRAAYTVGDGYHANEAGSRVAAMALKNVLESVVDGGNADVSAVGKFDDAAVAEAEAASAGRNHRWRDMADALIDGARCQLESGRLDKSIQHMADAARLRPDDVDLLADLALIRAQAGELEDALADFQKVVRLAPDVAKHRANLALVLSLMGRRKEAVAACQEAIKIDPDDPLAKKTYEAILGETR